MDEIAGLRARCELTSCTPAYLADAGQHVGNRLLLSMMMNSGPRSRFNLEQAAPDRRRDADVQRDGGATFGARRLCSSKIELIWADDANCSGPAHGFTITFQNR